MFIEVVGVEQATRFKFWLWMLTWRSWQVTELSGPQYVTMGVIIVVIISKGSYEDEIN